MALIARTVLIRSALAAVIVAGSASSLVLAQGRPSQPGDEQPRRQRGGGDEGGGGRRGGMGGGGMFGGGGFRGMFDSGVTTRQFESLKTILKLSKEQDEAVDALFEAYQDSTTELNNANREKMDHLREDMRAAMQDGEGFDSDAMKKMGEHMEKVRKDRKALETSLFNDVKSVLTPEQTQNWPRVEMGYRRESTIGRGLMAGERVDVVRLVDDLKLPEAERAPLNAVLDQYAADLDRELTARNEFQEKAMSQARELFQSGDQEKVQKLFDEGRSHSTRVRDVNRRYARQIEGMLPDSARATFAQSFQRESFPQIYRSTHGARTLEAALKLTDLDDEQKSTLASISESYKRDLGAINKEMEAAAEKREANFTPADMMGGRGRGWGGGDEQSRELRDRRRTLDDSTVEKVQKALRPEQVEKLPAREERGGFGGEGGGGGDDSAPRRNRRNSNDEGRPNRDIPRPAPGPSR
ncbi:MAG: Spy/CpxP family protein refolding chaperone [Phycisphaerales bacterium]|nr:Spy/CpxP family protein refolding chaperone [Phycisphaerales bacterium]